MEGEMADTKTDKQTTARSELQSGSLSRPQDRGSVRRWDPGYSAFANPFEFMDRLSEEMDRWFDGITGNFGAARRTGTQRGMPASMRGGMWYPRIEASQRGDTFLVRADLPGMTKEDIDVDLSEDAITIRGERKNEHQEEHQGYWHSEREYGQFYRTIPLPQGVIAESAKATFRDGVLEITLQAPPSEANRGRKLEIKDASESERK
jgi:HSP20 family protein